MFLIDMFSKKTVMPSVEKALPGRETPVATSDHHFVNGRALKEPYPEGLDVAYFGMGCFWGAERLFWQIPGVHVTSVGFATPADARRNGSRRRLRRRYGSTSKPVLVRLSTLPPLLLAVLPPPRRSSRDKQQRTT